MNTVEIHFDGGFNPGLGCYGSWEVIGAGVAAKRERERFGEVHHPSSNTAEYLSLLAALNQVRAAVPDVSGVSLEIFSDSLLVVNQVTNRWKNKTEHLQLYQGSVRNLLSAFASWRIQWVPRARNVARFGH